MAVSVSGGVATVTHNGIIITITLPSGVAGVYADGTAWVLGPATVTQTNPPYSAVPVAMVGTWRNYAWLGQPGEWPGGNPNVRFMNTHRKNPIYPQPGAPCTFDSDYPHTGTGPFVMPYLRPSDFGQQLPLSLAPGDVFIASKSGAAGDSRIRNPFASRGYDFPTVDSIAIVRCVATAPLSGTFRPWYAKPRWPPVAMVETGVGTNEIAGCLADVPVFRRAHLDLSLLPNLPRSGSGINAAAPTAAAILDLLKQPCFYMKTHGTSNSQDKLLNPLHHARDSAYSQGGWPRAYGVAAVAMCCDYALQEKLDIATCVVQWGIDAYYCMKARWAAMNTGTLEDVDLGGGFYPFNDLVDGAMTGGDWWKGHGMLPFIVLAGHLLRNSDGITSDPGLKIRTDLAQFIDEWPFYSFSERGSSYYIKTGVDADGSQNSASIAPTYDPNDNGATTFLGGARYAGFQTAAWSTKCAYIGGPGGLNSSTSWVPVGPVIDNTKTFAASAGTQTPQGWKLYGTRNNSGWWPEHILSSSVPAYTGAGGPLLGNPQPSGGVSTQAAAFRSASFPAGPYHTQSYRGYSQGCQEGWVLAFRLIGLEGAIDGAIPTSLLDYMDRHVTTWRLMAAQGSEVGGNGDSTQLWGGGDNYLTYPSQLNFWIRDMWDTYRRNAPYAGAVPPDDPPDPPNPLTPVPYAYLNSALGVSQAPIGSGITWDSATNVGTTAGSVGIAGKSRLIAGIGDYIVIPSAPFPTTNPVSFVWIGKFIPSGGVITPYTCCWQKATDIGLNHMFASLEVVPVAGTLRFRFRLRTQHPTPQIDGIPGLYEIHNLDTAVAVNTLYRVTCSYDLPSGQMHLHVSSGTSTHTTASGTCQSVLNSSTAALYLGITAGTGGVPGTGYPSQTKHELYEFQARGSHTSYDLHRTEHLQMANAAFVLTPGAVEERNETVPQQISLGAGCTMAMSAGDETTGIETTQHIGLVIQGQPSAVQMPMSCGPVHLSQGNQYISLGEFVLGGQNAAVEMPMTCGSEMGIFHPPGISLGAGCTMTMVANILGLNRVDVIDPGAATMTMSCGAGFGIQTDGLIEPAAVSMLMSVPVHAVRIFTLPQYVYYTVGFEGHGDLSIVTEAMLRRSKMEAVFFGNARRRRKGRR